MKKEYIIASIAAFATICAALISILPKFMDGANEQQVTIIPEGTYRQTSVIPSDFGECPQCEITILHRNKNTISIEANNDWSGYATFDGQLGAHKGTSEFKQGSGGNLEGTVSNITLFYENNTITMDMMNEKFSQKLQVTYRKKE